MHYYDTWVLFHLIICPLFENRPLLQNLYHVKIQVFYFYVKQLILIFLFFSLCFTFKLIQFYNRNYGFLWSINNYILLKNMSA